VSFEGSVVLIFLSNEFVSHGTKENSKPRPSKNERVGHPEKPNPERQNKFLGDNVLK
jgi:hypothetical protein